MIINSTINYNDYLINIYHNDNIDIQNIHNHILNLNSGVNARILTETIMSYGNIQKIDIYQNNQIILSTEYGQ